MNPILLKPTTDVGSQVIINGRVRGNMQATEHFRRKRDYIPAVLEAYNSLNSEYDMIVIEGAGSPKNRIGFFRIKYYFFQPRRIG